MKEGRSSSLLCSPIILLSRSLVILIFIFHIYIYLYLLNYDI